MFYVKEKVSIGVYAIVDTNDKTVDNCDASEIKKFCKLGIPIEGVELRGKTLAIKPIERRGVIDNIAFDYMDNNFSFDKVKGVVYKRYPVNPTQYTNVPLLSFMKSIISYGEDKVYTVTLPYNAIDEQFRSKCRILPISDIITIAFYRNELKTKKVIKG